MKKTKIIATIGPVSKDETILKELILSGMNIARINMTHSSHKFTEDIINKIKKIDKELSTNTSIMMDLKGPDITVNEFTGGSAYLNKQDKIRIYDDNLLGDSTKFSVSYSNFVRDIKTNTKILLNDGLIELIVLEKGPDYLLCEVINGGFIENYKGVNVINNKLKIPFLSTKDKEDIKLADKLNIDFLSLSFVSSSENILEINDFLIELKNDRLSIISKIENEAAIDDIDEIIRNSDGIMVARGDLGVEVPLERVPGIQKKIINKCHTEGKFSIVATEMMSSMETANRPSRAEVTDVANAVLEGTDAVMLSGETTVGKYPIETIEMMSKIIEEAEQEVNYYDFLDRTMRTEKQDITGTIAYSVVESSNRLKTKAIITPTISGYTARKISRFRPSVPILALSPDEKVVKNLNIYYGIYPILINEIKSFDKIMQKSKEVAIKMGFEKTDKIIVTGGYPFDEVKHTNFMKIEEI